MVRRVSRRNYRSKRVKSGRSRSLRKRVRSKSVRKIRRRKSRKMRGGQVRRIPYDPRNPHLNAFPWGVCNEAVVEGETESDQHGEEVECVKLKTINDWKNKMKSYGKERFKRGSDTLIWNGTGQFPFGPTESNAHPPSDFSAKMEAKRAAAAEAAAAEAAVVEETETFGFGD